MGRVPTNLITGFLGVGKTTTLRNLLPHKPPEQRWAVLINEYGEVGLDQPILEGSTTTGGVAIREIAGGCFCCTLALPLQVTLVELLREVKPHRLLLEATGVGHPAQLLDNLRGVWMDARIEVKSTLCLIDPHDWGKPTVSALPAFQDQIHLADVVVINKTDLVSPEVTQQCEAWLRELFPPKLIIASTTQGRIDPAWLDLDASPLRVPLFPTAHSHEHAHSVAESMPLGLAVKAADSDLAPGKPVRKEQDALGQHACGWIFSPADIFDRDKLLELLCGGYEVTRLKGVFNVGDHWLLVNRAGTGVTVEPIAYRRDSRLIVFREKRPKTWVDFEAALLGCLRRT